MHFSEIPRLGIGLAADVAGAMPNYRCFLNPDSADTIDYLSFGAHYTQKRRIAHYISDLVEARIPIVFHPVNFNVAIRADEPAEILEGTRDIVDYVSAVWMGQDVGVWSYKNHYLGPMLMPAIFDEMSALETAEQVKYIQAQMPCPYLVETPPVNAFIGRMHILEFIAKVSEAADCGIVLDLGHVIGYQQAAGLELDRLPWENFPFDRVVEIHVAGLQFSSVGDDLNIIDQHAYPVHEMCWELLHDIGKNLGSLKGLTLEQEYCADELVLKHLRIARKYVEELGIFRNAS